MYGQRGAATLAVGIALAGALTACGGNGDGDSPAEPVSVAIEFADGKVSPVGDTVEVEPGQPIDVTVTADEPGELHVHSDPEQELAYDEGTTSFEFEVDRPGKVAIESHDLDQVIVTLEVK